MGKLEDMLRIYTEEILTYYEQALNGVFDKRPLPNGTNLKQAIKDLVLDLIGPDERIEYHELPSVITRNELREELRKKVEKL